MNEKALAGLFGVLGVIVILGAVLLTAWSFLAGEDPVPVSSLDEPESAETDTESDVGPEEGPVASAGSAAETGPRGPRVIDPSLDSTEHLNVTYEKLKAALDRRDFARLQRLVAFAQGQVDPMIVNDLVALLEDKTHGFKAGSILGQIKTAGTVEVLYRFLLESESAVARRTAVQAMANSGGPAAVPRLLDLMEQGATKAIVAATAGALGMIGNEEATKGLLEIMSSGRWPDLDGSFQGALARARDPASVKLIGDMMLETNDTRFKKSLVKALGLSQNPAAVAPLKRLVTNAESVDLRAHGVNALGSIGNAEAVRTVLDLAKREGPLQNTARYALQNARDKTVLPDLVKSLETANEPGLERSLLVAIGSIGDRSATPRILEKLEASPSTDTRIAAVQALAKMKDPAAAKALGKTLKAEGHVSLRSQAARAIERIGDPANIPILEEALKQDLPENLKAVVRFSIRQLRLKRPLPPRFPK